MESLSPEERKAFVQAVQPNILEFDEAAGLIRVGKDASRQVANVLELEKIGKEYSKSEESLVTATAVPQRYWFRVEVRSLRCAACASRGVFNRRPYFRCVYRATARCRRTSSCGTRS